MTTEEYFRSLPEQELLKQARQFIESPPIENDIAAAALIQALIALVEKKLEEIWVLRDSL